MSGIKRFSHIFQVEHDATTISVSRCGHLLWIGHEDADGCGGGFEIPILEVRNLIAKIDEPSGVAQPSKDGGGA